MELIDNITKTLHDDLTVEIKEASRGSISPTFTAEKIDKQRREFYFPRIDRERTLYGSPFEVKLRNRLTQKAIAIIAIDDEREKLHKQILALEVKAHQEKQPGRKLEMFEELQKLKKKCS